MHFSDHFKYTVYKYVASYCSVMIDLVSVYLEIDIWNFPTRIPNSNNGSFDIWFE